MNEILFIRHAETDLAGTFCGHSNPPLNARGHAQLAALIAKLRTEDLHSIYTSDLLRAHTTAQAIAEALVIPCHLRPALREIHFGQWEGRTWDEIEQRDQDYAKRWLAAYPELPAPDGENISNFEHRVLSEIALLANKAQQGTIAVVTHGGVIRTALCRLCGYTEQAAWEQTRPYGSILRYSLLNHPALEQIRSQ